MPYPWRYLSSVVHHVLSVSTIRDRPFDIRGGGGGLGFFLVTSYIFLSFSTISYFF